MQAISGSVGLSLASTEVGDISDLTSGLGADMASGLGFLALFITQIESATTDLKAPLNLPDLLKGHIAGGDLNGKLFPQELPQRSSFTELLSGKGAGQLLESKLFSNMSRETMSREMFSTQGLVEALQGDGESDSFIQSLIQEAGTSALRGKGAQTGATGFAAITDQLGNQGWGDELVSRVKWQIGKEIQEVKISLNPRELGPLQVKINIIDDQAHVQFVAHHGSVRDAIEEAIPRLREMLEQTGLMLADADVSQQSPDQDRTFFEMTGDTSELSENGAEIEEQEQQVKVIRQGVGLVDAFI